MKEKMEALLREAGEIMLSAREIEKSVTEKEGTANFVTAYDVRVQHLLQKKLGELFPEARFLGEEEDCRTDPYHGEVFVADPIDGTTNFIRHYDASAVSVALLRDGRAVMGATYDPYRDEFCYAERGRGATCNGRTLHVASGGLRDNIVCLGTSPYHPELIPATFRAAETLMTEALDLRRSGSAVLDLCHVAKGSAGLMFEVSLCPWDHAAAGLLVEEAGGRVTRLDGSPVCYDRPCSILAGTPAACDDFLRLGLDFEPVHV